MRRGLAFLCVLLVAGCAAPPEPAGPVVDPRKAMEVVGHGVQPQVLIFPEYLLMEDFELEQHGRIPETRLVGAGMKSSIGLLEVRRRFGDRLAAEGWATDKVEMGSGFFRLMASKQGEQVEIRAVQGSGDVQVFVLYEPAPESAVK